MPEKTKISQIFPLSAGKEALSNLKASWIHLGSDLKSVYMRLSLCSIASFAKPSAIVLPSRYIWEITQEYLHRKSLIWEI